MNNRDANTNKHVSISDDTPDSSDDTGSQQIRYRGSETQQDEPQGGDTKSLFPYILYTLLEDTERDGYDAIVCWRPCGKAFKVIKRDEFMNQVLPRYFKQTKYKSFVRQLNLWGFSCLQDGADRGSCKCF
jgi:hypothetical protein